MVLNFSGRDAWNLNLASLYSSARSKTNKELEKAVKDFERKYEAYERKSLLGQLFDVGIRWDEPAYKVNIMVLKERVL